MSFKNFDAWMEQNNIKPEDAPQAFAKYMRDKADWKGSGHPVTVWRNDVVMMENKKEEWVPAIPMPYQTRWNRLQCDCGKKFWDMELYKGHFALHHILMGE